MLENEEGEEEETSQCGEGGSGEVLCRLEGMHGSGI